MKRSPHHGAVRVVDRDYAAIARATTTRIQWARLLRNPEWKWLENARNFSIYTKPEIPLASGFCVLATGVVRGSVREIAALLEALSQQDYEHKVGALYGKAFKSGAFIRDVGKADGDATPRQQQDQAHAKLSICSATLASQSWLRRDETSCFLEATTYDRQRELFGKYMTALKLADTLVGDDTFDDSGVNNLQNVICGYRVQAETVDARDHEREREGGARTSARVHFFAERVPLSTRTTRGPPRCAVRSRKREASMDAVHKAMLNLARLCERLSLIVRRRRLGVQVLVDPRASSLHTHSQCVNCDTRLVFAKRCRVCGNAVCKDCSDKYERETRRPLLAPGIAATTRTRIDTVRICDPCLTRIESADYSNTSDSSLAKPAVVPDRESILAGATTSDLKTLLQTALLEATSPHRKDAVMSVIRYMLDQERDPARRPRAKASSLSSTISSASSLQLEQEYLDALDSSFKSESVVSTDVKLAGHDGRSYLLDPDNEAAFPVPNNETRRLRAIEDLHVVDKSAWHELNVICDLAAKVICASTSMVTVVTHDEQHIVASNTLHFLAMRTGRDNAFCAHTIMESRPLIVPHPEADYRMSHIVRKWDTSMDVRFYCGFPLKADDHDAVIGALCCIDQKSHELTASQYSAMARLAKTATKIIRVEAAKKKRSTIGVEHVQF